MNNNIHPTAIIDDLVDLGDNNYIGPYTVIQGPTRIGHGNWIGPHVTIGTPGQDTRTPHYDCTEARIEIGDNNIIREYTAIQKPCYRDITKIGNKVFIMQGVHIPHDAIIHDDVVLTPSVALGGIVRILRGATLALGSTVHQYSVIGQYSIVGMGAAVTKNIRPFSKYVPGKPLAVNTYAIEKFGFDDFKEEIADYVLNHTRPQNASIQKMVEEFETLATDSKRPAY